jgi:hypothetical protein
MTVMPQDLSQENADELVVVDDENGGHTVRSA